MQSEIPLYPKKLLLPVNGRPVFGSLGLTDHPDFFALQSIVEPQTLAGNFIVYLLHFQLQLKIIQQEGTRIKKFSI